jgi:hypothetical protein
MKRAEVTYGQLDKVLRALGFSCRMVVKDGEARRYEHAQTGALILLPAYPEADNVLEIHLFMVRATLENFGISDPTTFDKKLQKAG